jgi:hypothetical protein
MQIIEHVHGNMSWPLPNTNQNSREAAGNLMRARNQNLHLSVLLGTSLVFRALRQRSIPRMDRTPVSGNLQPLPEVSKMTPSQVSTRPAKVALRSPTRIQLSCKMETNCIGLVLEATDSSLV